jgi:hypothetical protein
MYILIKGCGNVINSKDKELLKVMDDSLKRYLKAASLISQEAFNVLSEHNGLLWSEISTQKDILEELIKKYNIENTVGHTEAQTFGKSGTEQKQEEEKEAKEHKVEVKEDGPVSLYNKVVEFMKKQKCDELQWVRTYSFKCNYEDYEDFQIKYFEHKDALHSGKNYIMFGNISRNYSIRKSGEDIVGDTSECFEIILNLSNVFEGV